VDDVGEGSFSSGVDSVNPRSNGEVNGAVLCRMIIEPWWDPSKEASKSGRKVLIFDKY